MSSVMDFHIKADAASFDAICNYLCHSSLCSSSSFDASIFTFIPSFSELEDPPLSFSLLRDMALQFIEELSIALHSVSSVQNASQHVQLIYVISPPSSQDITQDEFGPQYLDQLNDYVDGFLLMTYDFSSPRNPGPNAPLSWIHSSLQLLLHGDLSHASRIFVGIDFYGSAFALVQGLGGGVIFSRDYVSLLKRHRPTTQWKEKSREHFFLYSDDNNVKHVVFYSTPLSISMRLDKARSWEAAISIWEIGQGLDYLL